MLCGKSIVNRVTFMLREWHDTPYYIMNDNTKNIFKVQTRVKIQPEYECVECECIE